MSNSMSNSKLYNIPKEDGNQGALILMDFMKAYDRINRKVMMKVLEKMNIGKDVRKIIKALYKESRAQVEVNGELSRPMDTTGGVRQGCPLSSYLFIIVLEILTLLIEEDKEIEGITEPITGKEDKLTQFADDSSGMMKKIGDIRPMRAKVKMRKRQEVHYMIKNQ